MTAFGSQAAGVAPSCGGPDGGASGLGVGSAAPPCCAPVDAGPLPLLRSSRPVRLPHLVA